MQVIRICGGNALRLNSKEEDTCMQKYLNSVFAGFLIGIGNLAIISTDRYVGAFLFSVALLSIIELRLPLYTGRIGKILFPARGDDPDRTLSPDGPCQSGKAADGLFSQILQELSYAFCRRNSVQCPDSYSGFGKKRTDYGSVHHVLYSLRL